MEVVLWRSTKCNTSILIAIEYMCKYVSESDLLSPIDFLSDIEDFVSIERAMFEELQLSPL